MRLVGKLDSNLLADRFSDFLLANEIESRVEPDGHHFAVWVRDEQRIEQAREMFVVFKRAPDMQQYTDATSAARTIRKAQAKRKKEIEKKTIDVRSNWATPRLAQCRVTMVLMVTAVAVSWAGSTFCLIFIGHINSAYSSNLASARGKC